MVRFVHWSGPRIPPTLTGVRVTCANVVAGHTPTRSAQRADHERDTTAR